MLGIVQAIAPQGSDVTQAELDGALLRLIETKARHTIHEVHVLSNKLSFDAAGLVKAPQLTSDLVAPLLTSIDDAAEKLMHFRLSLERRLEAYEKARQPHEAALELVRAG
ncbi:MAG: hypothetical protein V4617_14990 [Gemmatimonadota bacterium]